MKPEDIKNKKIAVLCDALNETINLYKICRGSDDIDTVLFMIFCSHVGECMYFEDKYMHFCKKEWCESHDYTIITFEQFMEDTQEEPLTAVEVLEVLVNEYITGKYIEIFGYNPCFLELTSRFTPAEIVQKVTEWKRKQDNKIRVTEDMIADVLDEKYGIGNWGRE